MKQKINITLDADLVRMIDKLAKAESRNRSNYINLVLKRYLEDKKNGKQ